MSEKPLVLVVDDEAGIRNALKRYLTKAGYEVHAEDDGAKAFDAVQRLYPKLVLLDVMMPQVDGFSALEEIRKRYSAEEIPVLMATALDDKEHIIRAMRLGANDYTDKPFNMVELLERVAKNIRKDAVSAGDHVGPYQVLEQIGTGGAGTVFSAVEEMTQRKVAVKVLSSQLVADSEFVARFLREAKVGASIDHPNVVQIYTAGRVGASYYISMELVEGEDLFNIANRKPMSLVRALDVARQIALGLEELQRHELIHRDIKPENILLGDDGRVRITDFGLAREVFSEEQVTAHGMAVGTLPYISPEQLLGKVDYRSDIYSLGATLFYTLTGVPPFSNDDTTSEIIRRKFLAPPRVRDRLANTPGPVDDWVASLMATDVEERPQTYGEIIAQLDVLMASS